MYMFNDKLNYMTSVNSNRYEGKPDIIQGKKIVEVDVPLEKFTTLFDKYNFTSLDLIKIDVEGHVIQVLTSMIDLIKKFKPAILVEILSDDIAKSLNKLLEGVKYNFIEIDEISKPRIVKQLNNNHHHNYLLCSDNHKNFLLEQNLIES
jgi:hypothetical protein